MNPNNVVQLFKTLMQEVGVGWWCEKLDLKFKSNSKLLQVRAMPGYEW